HRADFALHRNADGSHAFRALHRTELRAGRGHQDDVEAATLHVTQLTDEQQLREARNRADVYEARHSLSDRRTRGSVRPLRGRMQPAGRAVRRHGSPSLLPDYVGTSPPSVPDW